MRHRAHKAVRKCHRPQGNKYVPSACSRADVRSRVDTPYGPIVRMALLSRLAYGESKANKCLGKQAAIDRATRCPPSELGSLRVGAEPFLSCH